MFAAGYPTLLGKDGLPLSWGHFQLGLAHLVRARTRDAQRMARAHRIAQNPEGAFERWDRIHQIAGE
jgi:hypothetical protein